MFYPSLIKSILLIGLKELLVLCDQRQRLWTCSGGYIVNIFRLDVESEADELCENCKWFLVANHVLYQLPALSEVPNLRCVPLITPPSPIQHP